MIIFKFSLFLVSTYTLFIENTQAPEQKFADRLTIGTWDSNPKLPAHQSHTLPLGQQVNKFSRICNHLFLKHLNYGLINKTIVINFVLTQLITNISFTFLLPKYV